MREFRTSIRLVAGALFVLSTAAPALAELGWREADYVKRFGPASRSPLAANEAQFAAKGGRILVIFAHGRSREEAWLIEGDAGFVPPALMRQARAAMKGKPTRRVDFKLETAAAAEIFETRRKNVTIQVDVRSHGAARIAQCRGVEKCAFIDRLLSIDAATDDLLARTQTQMRREQRQRRP